MPEAIKADRSAEGEAVATRTILREMTDQARLFPRVYAAYREYQQMPDDPAALLDLQHRRLAAQLRRIAGTVPFYYRDNGYRAPSADPLADLATLPLVARETVRGRLVDLCVDDIDPALCRFGRTSGTSGVPLKVIFDEAHFVHLFALAQVRNERYGLRFHQRVLVPFQNWLKGWFEYTAAAQGLARVAEFGRDERLLRRAVEFRPDLVFGHPSDCIRLARLVEPPSPNAVRPTAVLTYGERLLPETRRTLAGAFQAPVFDVYGMREVGTIAAECVRGSYHIEAERLLVEVVDGDGNAVPDGEPGELVVTNLVTEAMPLVRYRTGDVGALATEPCDCGRPQPVLRLVEGRELPGIELPTGEVLAVALLARTIRSHPVERYQLVQEGPDRLLVLLRPAPHADLPLDAVRADLRADTGGSMHIEVRAVDDDGFVQAGHRKHVDLVRLCPATSALGFVDNDG